MDPTMSHADLEQLAAGYVLGALEPDDEQAFSRHLNDCQLCQAEVGELESVVGELAYAVPQVEPPKALRNAIRREVGLTRRRRALLSLRLPTTPLLPRVAMAFSLVAILVLGFWNFSLRNELSLEHRRQQLIEQALQVAAAPSGRVELAPTGGGPARATLLVRQDTSEGALIVAQMPDLPSGKVWQFWVVPPGKGPADAEPGRIWVSGEAAAAVPLGKLPMFTGATFAVTDEPSGGSPHPTGQIVIMGTQSTA
jgi:anti-sigma-K factor RskA